MVATTGNTLGAPPRLSGDPQADIMALQLWVRDLYQALVEEANVLGTQRDMTAALTALTTRVTAAEAKLAAIAELPFLTGSISATYDATQLAAAFNKINDILEGAQA